MFKFIFDYEVNSAWVEYKNGTSKTIDVIDLKLYRSGNQSILYDPDVKKVYLIVLKDNKKIDWMFEVQTNKFGDHKFVFNDFELFFDEKTLFNSTLKGKYISWPLSITNIPVNIDKEVFDDFKILIDFAGDVSIVKKPVF